MDMGLRCGLLTLLLLLASQWAAGSPRWPCFAQELQCDFFCDCTDCKDEEDCGYKGKDWVCDFEDSKSCGWTDQSLVSSYTWQRRQRGATLPDSGPSSDFTTGTAAGWFMGVTAVMSDTPRTAVLESPTMAKSAATCRMQIRYFLWDSGYTGLGAAPLWASVWREADSQQAVVWRPEGSSMRGWREATVFLGRIAAPFRIRLHSQRSQGRRGDVAVDQLAFLDCGLPVDGQGESCPDGFLRCQRGGCVAQNQVCDGTDDCGDGTDEATCGEYRSCNFDNGPCNWDPTLSPLKWIWTNQASISLTDPLKGPGRDHSTNTAAGNFMYVTVPEEGLTADWAALWSPVLDPTNSTHPCKMVMYSHQFGPRAGGLSVLVADKEVYPVWQRGGALGDLWVKAEIEVVTSTTFQIILVAAIRDREYGGIAVDSITMSSGCRISNGNSSLEKIPNPPKHPCTDNINLICDFHGDCPQSEDEAQCGDFSYKQGSSGWTDCSIGSQGWVLNITDQFLYVAQAPGQQLTEAQTRTPLLGPSGPACTLTFSYSLTGTTDHLGELSVRLIDSLMGIQPRLWEFSGHTGSVEGAWKQAEVHLGVWDQRFQLEFAARAMQLHKDTRIAVKDVYFLNCHPDNVPASPTGLSCNFEEGLCGWYQDHADNFDWAVLSGMDHSIGIGKSLAVDVWSPELRGLSARLVSYEHPRSSEEHCLSFYYKLYGPETGVLNVKLRDSRGFELLLWTRTGAHGNEWHEGHCSIVQQPTAFQVVFEAVRSGFDGRVAIDDVVFSERLCSVPKLCSFEGQQCGYTSSGSAHWLHVNGQSTLTGPRTDHTLETSMGYYMMSDTSAEVLPQGALATLTSTVRQGVARTECVHFWYHAGGKGGEEEQGGGNPGTLNVYIKPVKGDRVKIFSNSLGQGDVWRHGNANISGTTIDWHLEFEVVGGGDKDSHVAIDDVTFSTEPCLSQGSKCSLEQDLCGWTNTQNPAKDQLDWERTSAGEELHYPTPLGDHTLGTNKGHFLFLPSSSRDTASYKAQLLSPHLPPTKGTCLRFWAHRPSSADSHLRVWRVSGDQPQQLLEVKEVAAVWKRFDVNITSTEEYQIMFEGFKGTSGVFALDDIEYTVGFNCAGESTTDTTTPKDDSAGIAASVIVVLLLIGSLGALLYFYLRARERAMAALAARPPPPTEGFSNETYEPRVTQDRVSVPPVHPAVFDKVPMAAVALEEA